MCQLTNCFYTSSIFDKEKDQKLLLKDKRIKLKVRQIKSKDSSRQRK